MLPGLSCLWRCLVKKPVIAFDTETFLIGPGNITPKLVCVSVAGPQGMTLIGNGDADLESDLRELFELGHTLVGHNVAFDLCVVAKAFPDLEPLIWEKLLAGECDDTMIREQLLNLSTHGNIDNLKLPDGTKENLSYSLASLVAKYLGLDITAAKEDADAWRLNYDKLDGLPASSYPAEASAYALEDAEFTLRIYHDQQARVRTEDGPSSLSTGPFHTAAAFALRLMTDRGMKVDKERVEELHQKLLTENADSNFPLLLEAGVLRPSEPEQPYVRQLEKARGILREAGIEADSFLENRELLESNGIKFKAAVTSSINTTALKDEIEKTCKENRLKPKLTDKGQLSTDAEVISDLSAYSEILSEYGKRQELAKLVSTDVPAFFWEGEIADTVHFNFAVLKETGRTASYGNSKSKKPLFPARNGQQADPRARPGFCARDGFYLASIDYSTLELATVAQTMINLFGYSVHADKINAGIDLHAYLGAQLAYELHSDFRNLCSQYGVASSAEGRYRYFMQCKGHADERVAKFFKHWRKMAKPVGLGYPGGLGPAKFIGLAKNSYGVNLLEVAQEFPESRFEVTDYLKGLARRTYGMEEFQWTRGTKALALATFLREIWLTTFEMQQYFDHVQNDCIDPKNDRGFDDRGVARKAYCYTSPMGMYRAGCAFTAAANGKAMQTPAAEGAKSAVIEVQRECRIGSLTHCALVDFIHDEILAEVPRETAHRDVEEIAHLMVRSMRRITPDVDIKAEPALMVNWWKEAEPVFDANGRLLPWEPGISYVTRDGKLYLP